MKKTLVDWLGKYTSWVTGDYELTHIRETYQTKSGWWYTYSPEKYWSVGMMTFPTEWKNNKCLKPPTRNYMNFIYIHRITWASAVAA